jgi:ABC-2 type transport system permease protein
MRELWIGGRALNLLILFSVMMSITVYILVSNRELSLIPLKQTVLLAVQSNISFGLFIGLVIGADSISGERERATLEAILLTPTSRRQIVFGKFLAALSPWPAALIFSIPYMVTLSQGDAVLGPALVWGAIVGTIVAAAFTSFGILVSIFANTNRTSLLVSILIYLLSLLPTQLPGETQAGTIGAFLQTANPLEAARQFLLNTLLNDKPFSEVSEFLLAPVLLAVILLALLFFYASSRIHLEGGRASLLPSRLRRSTSIAALACLIVGLSVTTISAARPQHAPTEGSHIE